MAGGRLLNFSQFLGGASNVQLLEMFPDDQKRFTYDFNVNVSTWTFTADYQSILIDEVAYDRQTGLPDNLADSTVIGFFENTANVDAQFIDTTFAATGKVDFTIPSQRYTGNVIPNARENVVATVVSFEWETDDTPPIRERHRWVVIERYDPKTGRNPGFPQDEANFVPLTPPVELED